MLKVVFKASYIGMHDVAFWFLGPWEWSLIKAILQYGLDAPMRHAWYKYLSFLPTLKTFQGSMPDISCGKGVCALLP